MSCRKQRALHIIPSQYADMWLISRCVPKLRAPLEAIYLYRLVWMLCMVFTALLTCELHTHKHIHNIILGIICIVFYFIFRTCIQGNSAVKIQVISTSFLSLNMKPHLRPNIRFWYRIVFLWIYVYIIINKQTHKYTPIYMKLNW